jgi:hypothetical protein
MSGHDSDDASVAATKTREEKQADAASTFEPLRAPEVALILQPN